MVVVLFVFKVISDECVCVCVCPSPSDFSETVEVIIVKRSTMTTPDMGMHHVLIILTLTFIQGHTDLKHEDNNMFDYVRNYSSNAHQVCYRLMVNIR